MNRLNNNTLSKITRKTSPRTQLGLTKVSKSTRRIVKPSFNQIMNRSTKLTTPREKMIRNLIFLFREIFGDEWQTEWTDEFFVYMEMMGSPLDDNLFEGLLSNESGFRKLMNKLDLNTLRGFYSWINGKFLDYMKMNHAFGTVSNRSETKSQFAKRATRIMNRPTPQIGAWN